MSISTIRHFQVNDKHYHHNIDTESDSVLLMDHTHSGPIIEYSYNCLMKEDGKAIGKFERQLCEKSEAVIWVYKFRNSDVVIPGRSASLAEGLLDFEVEISTLYLQCKAGGEKFTGAWYTQHCLIKGAGHE